MSCLDQDPEKIKIKRAVRKSKAKIWRTVLERLSHHEEMNLGRLSKFTSKGQVIIVPGKVLAGGLIDHSITIGAKSFSGPARRKIIRAGGRVLTIDGLIEAYPEGKGVRLLVG